jgi:spore maturation protein CgeB
MKFCFLTSYYSPFLVDFFKKNDCTVLSYSQTLQLLLSKFFADTGSLAHHVEKAGNETFLIISNCEVLQKKWATENNIVFTEKWAFEIAFAQIKKFSPDVFYLEYVTEFFGDFVKTIKPYCKKVVSWISSPLYPNARLNDIDLVFSSTPNFVESFRNQGIKSEYMHPAFDDRILNHLPAMQSKTIPFSFVGGWSDVHVNRKVALTTLVEKTPLQLWGYGYKPKLSVRDIKYYSNLLFPKNKLILGAYNGEAWGLEMLEIIQKSIITFNVHEDLLKGFVGNMRMFEATGVGTMILNDNGTNLSSLFEVGKEIEVYHSIPEAIEKVNYYLKNTEKALIIGENAQKRTLKDYNYDKYVEMLTVYLSKIY